MELRRARWRQVAGNKTLFPDETDFDSAFMLICWLIWKERNVKIFQHVSKTPEQLEEIAVWRVAGIFSQFRE
uniref:Uncharacterized protein n=1 Tax=Oryza nivara TaxID=4536 RepID=A0A0E0IWS7_ORYNI